MAAYISFQPTDFFKTLVYTGNGSATSAHTYPETTAMKPDFVWFKDRTGTYPHMVMDSVRGANYYLYPSATNSSTLASDRLKTFDSDGFTIGDGATINLNTNKFASWSWKAGTTSGISTTGSTITPTAYTFNQTSKFSVVKYPGNSTAGAKVPHGLGVAPDMVIVKSLVDHNWVVQHKSLGPTKYMYLDTNAAAATNTNRWNDTAPDAVNVTLGNTDQTNGTGGGNSPFIMYSFAGVRGASKFDSFTGNANVDGPFVYTGFRPNMIIIKNISGQNWNLFDGVRNPSNVANKTFTPDTDAAEATNGTGAGDKKIDILSNGFKIRTNSNELNQSGVEHIYMAWAKNPIVSSNSKAGTAR